LQLAARRRYELLAANHYPQTDGIQKVYIPLKSYIKVMSADQPRTAPEYRILDRESDIANLIPGDRVIILIDHGRKPRWMVYGGHKPVALNQSTNCAFIELPDGYKGEEVDIFGVWESFVKYLQFPGGHIEFDSYHRNLRAVQAGTEEYALMKNLADMLE
jgi:hypothetical protein